MMMMKLHILACAEKLETYSLVYRTKNHELKPIITVKTENGPIGQGKEVSPECLWWEIYGGKDLPEMVSFEFRVNEWRCVMDGESGE